MTPPHIHKAVLADRRRMLGIIAAGRLLGVANAAVSAALLDGTAAEDFMTHWETEALARAIAAH